ncbi:MAG: S26 family signal peptidase [Sphingomonadales bacterium]|nr:MAG: S26 family signal peptidase [Sphingomonadales bacterium]
MTAATGSRAPAALRWGIGCAALVIGLGVTMCRPPQPRFVWNVSASAPIGLWFVAPDAAIDRGDMVVARLPSQWRAMASRRRYLPANVPLIKRVAAVSGDTICADGPRIRVNGVVVAEGLQHDKSGRSLPSWPGCRLLRNGALLLLMEHPASFDGRYFGPTQHTDIIGRAAPLWVR